ncbi:glycoside hydrolase family 3 protein [Propionibacteriaceae bacterium Y2011]
MSVTDRPVPSHDRIARAAFPRRRVLQAGLAAAAGAAVLQTTAPAEAAMRREGWIRSRIARMSVEQQVGQLFVMRVYGNDATASDNRNMNEYGVASPAEIVAKYHLGGVIYFAWADNLPTPAAGARLSNGLQRAALAAPGKVAVPLTISTDQETGIVARMPDPATVFPGAMALGAGRDPELTYDTYEITGAELRAVGVNNDYAPLGDVNVNPANPVIGVRSFSADPALVAELLVAGVNGLQSQQVSATAKHFPGHGDTDVDSHTGFPVIHHTREEWETIDAPPFRAAVEAGIDAIMTAHINVPALDPSGDPATLSKPIITDILRGELGFTGVVVTDSLGMAGVREKYGDAEVAIRAVEAGVDQLLNTPAADVQYNAVLDAVRSGRISRRRLDESLVRILGMKYDRGLHRDPFVDESAVDEIVGNATHKARAQEIADQTITLLRDDADLVPLPAGEVLVTGYGDTTTVNLAASLSDHGHPAQAFVTGSSPSQTLINSAVTRSAAAAVTVVLTYGADTNTAQQQLLQALRDAGRKVVVVAVRNPYDIAGLGDTPTYLATYSWLSVSTEALAKVLAGEIPAAGRLPVSIPSQADPDTELFGFGAGMDN